MRLIYALQAMCRPTQRNLVFWTLVEVDPPEMGGASLSSVDRCSPGSEKYNPEHHKEALQAEGPVLRNKWTETLEKVTGTDWPPPADAPLGIHSSVKAEWECSTKAKAKKA